MMTIFAAEKRNHKSRINAPDCGHNSYFWIGGFPELFTDAEINEDISEFVRAKIRARIRDPQIADKLIPRDHGFGTRRVPLETQYFEAYNRDNVELVDVAAR